MKTETIETIEVGYKKLLIKLEQDGYKIDIVKPINNNRYLIIKGNPENLLIIFKRDPFYNFGTMFNGLGFKGVGDTINVKDLKVAIRNKVDRIYIIFPRGIVYTILLEEFLSKSLKWLNKEGIEVRSISIHEYTRSYEI